MPPQRSLARPANGDSFAKALLDASVDALYALAPDGRVLRWSWGAENIYGHTAAEAVGRSVLDLLVPPERADELRAAVAEAQATGSAVLDTLRRRRDGADIRVQAVLRGVPGVGGAAGFIAVGERDVTDQHRLEGLLFDQLWSLREMEAFLKSVLDASPDHAIVAMDLDHRIRSWNAGAERLYRRSAADALDKDGCTLLAPEPGDARAAVEAACRQALEAGTFEGELLHARADGSAFPARVSIDVRRDSHGVPAGFVAIARDVTSEKESAQALRREAMAVQLLQRVAVAANEAQTVEQAMQTTLDEVCAATGWQVGHVYTRSGEWAGDLAPTRLWHLADAARFETFRTLTEATRFPPGVGLPGRVLATGKAAWIMDVTKDDNFPPARVATDIGVRAAFGFPVWVGTEIVAVLEFFSDRPAEPDERLLDVMTHVGTQLGRVVERKRALDEHRVSLERYLELERLKEINAFKEQFIRTVSHELNTPLTPIKVQLHLLRSSGAPLEPPRAHALDVVERNVDRLELLVQDMLDVARIQGGRLQLQKSATDVGACVAEALELFREAARAGGITLGSRLAGDVEADADGRRVVQVLFNLVSNALKFTPAGGHVDVEAGRTGEAVTVRVRDTGAGLTPDQMARLFQPFGQVHDPAATSVPGTGLGLYICKGIVEQHGGRIWCESPGPRQGATFSFSLPTLPRSS